MADSIREKIIQAAVAALEAAGKPAELTVHRNRELPIEDDNLPAMIVFYGEDDPRSRTHDNTSERTLTLAIETRASTTVAGTPGDKVTDPYTNWMTQALMADDTLGGLATSVVEGTTLPGSKTTSKAVHAFAGTAWTIKYITATDNPEVQP